MLIRNLTLTNFGTYGGLNEIDLGTEPDRPIVLIGGSNGAGKTTILESILLCLHGRRALGSAVSVREYNEAMRTRFHVPAEGSWRPSECAVSLTFDLAEGGHKARYDVTRRWRRSSTGAVRETLELRLNGEFVSDLPRAAWQDFLDNLVPPGIAGLFFFDGERIQALADDESGTQLREAVRRLLGLDLIEQLRLDLARVVSGKQREGLNSAQAALVEQTEAVQAARDRLRVLREQRANLLVRRESLAAEAQRTRDVFSRRGGKLAVQRERLAEKHRRAREAAAAGEAQVRDLVVGLLPFALCPRIAGKVAARIEAEAAAEEAAIVGRRLEVAAPALRRQFADAETDVVDVLRTILGADVEVTGDRLHDLTPRDRAVLANQLARLREEIPEKARKLASALRRAEEARARTRELLEKAPPESEVADLIHTVQEQERQLAAVAVEVGQLDEAIGRGLYDHKVAERERKKAAEAMRETKGRTTRAGYAIRTQAVLAEFEERSQRNKLAGVEVEAARFFNRLSRKGSLLGRVRIDPDSFRVELRRWDDADLPRERLSAGEKQLLAISLLWALAKVSGRPLPMVIDTPLARLDREHRSRLLHEYFPSVSHQVLVLSTDTEVDEAAAATLEPFVSRVYRLVHHAEECRTEVQDGYFVKAAEASDAR